MAGVGTGRESGFPQKCSDLGRLREVLGVDGEVAVGGQQRDVEVVLAGVVVDGLGADEDQVVEVSCERGQRVEQPRRAVTYSGARSFIVILSTRRRRARVRP